MRIEELLDNYRARGSLSPSQYASVAAKRDKELQREREKSQRQQDAEQKRRQELVWGKKPAKPVKPAEYGRSKPKKRPTARTVARGRQA